LRYLEIGALTPIAWSSPCWGITGYLGPSLGIPRELERIEVEMRSHSHAYMQILNLFNVARCHFKHCKEEDNCNISLLLLKEAAIECYDEPYFGFDWQEQNEIDKMLAEWPT
jgi:hypothetical protein